MKKDSNNKKETNLQQIQTVTLMTKTTTTPIKNPQREPPENSNNYPPNRTASNRTEEENVNKKLTRMLNCLAKLPHTFARKPNQSTST